MMQFTVPQFIDVEDKIIGPITVRQFMVMLFGFLIMAIFYKVFDFSLFLTLSLVLFAVCSLFAFFKVNGMPFHFFVLNFIQTSKRPFLRVWNSGSVSYADDIDLESKEMNEITPVKPKSISTSRLTELSLIVDTKGAYRGELVSDKINIEDLNKKNLNQ